MFYKLLGMAVWRLATKYVLQNYGRQLRAAAGLAVVTVAVAAYLAARSGD